MSGLPNIQENNEKLLNDIQSLQQMEQQLFNSLESNTSLSSEEQTKIVEKMNQLSNMRVNLYKTLSGVNNYFDNALNTSISTLKEQAIAIQIVESELNRSKKRLRTLEEAKNNKIRLVEINTYYGDKYAEHSDLMKIVIFTLIPIIILTLLNKTILPNTLYYILLVIVAFIGAYYFWTRFTSIIMRDNMNYQEYDWYFDPNAAPSGSSSSDDPWISGVDLGTCIGNACCSEGLVYDSALNQCVFPKTQESFTTDTETSINNILTKTQEGKRNYDHNLKELEAFNTQH